MNSETWLTVLLLLFFLILATGLVLLYLSTLREMKRQQLAQSEFLAKTLEIQVTLSENARESLQEQQNEIAKSDREFLNRMTVETANRLEANQQQTIKTIDLMATRAANGLTVLNGQTTEVLQATLAMLGTKDPLAYQMVRGASPIPDDGSVSPYTAADQVAEKEAEIESLNAAQRLLESMGLVNDGAGTFGSDSAGSSI